MFGRVFLYIGGLCVCVKVDPTGSGRVAAADAALFLKRSGLADLVLGKIWDLADSERKGSLNKQQFFIALRLVACAQNGLEVSLKSLNVAVPPPKFHDTSSPLLAGGVTVDIPWAVKPEEKMKFDAIFDSLGPVGGMLSGDKVKPVLLNSKLPVDILGRVWELSDLDRDGMLDKDEFSVAMYLVYRALEGEPVPMSLPPPLVPPSKRKKPSVPPVMPLLPSPPSVKDSRSSHAVSVLSCVQWVVSPADKAKYDELFNKTDGDMDGLVSGPEVRDIFLKTGLPSATLARIWELCDIGDIGKLTREQFALALHLINQKLTKGLDPPQSLTPEMIPPSDRQNIKQVSSDFSAIKELDSLSNEIVELQREKSSVEEEIKEKEEAIRERSSEVQDLQDDVAKESEELQRLQTQRQKVQEALDELDQQKGSLEEQLAHIRQQTSQETQLISSLQSEHEEQEQRICQYEEELVQAREELLALQEESRRLQEKVQAAQEQLTPLQESVRDSFTQVAQVSFMSIIVCVGDRACSVQDSPQSSVTFQQVASPEQENKPEPEESPETTTTSLPVSLMPPQTSPPSLPEMDFFHSDPFTDHDPFKDDPFGKADVADPFGADPFKGTDPFAADSFFTQTTGASFSTEDPFSTSADPFGTTSAKDPFSSTGNDMAESDPFGGKANATAEADPFGCQDGETDPFSCSQVSADLAVVSTTNDPFAPGGTTVSASSDPDPFAAVFGSESFGGGFADFSALTKSNGADQFGINNKNLFHEESGTAGPDVPPALPPKTGTPTRPPPPPPGQELCIDAIRTLGDFVNRLHVSVSPLILHLCILFFRVCVLMKQYPTEEDMIEWAKRESEREEKERLARLTQQEQEDLELAIALSKSELS
uniref:Epidermal growth factor receptor pathway substrate 15 n=1 Tax=Echeneis naucrates TaxID=173247 RepID=A0A665U6S3_ECHNA